MNKKPLFMEHDGAIDDLLAQLLILTMDQYELIGINVSPADCYIGPAMESTWKILKAFGKENIEIGRSDASGTNDFPAAWRAKTAIINGLPAILRLPEAPETWSAPEASDLLTRKLLESKHPVTILMTGPCTNLVKSLEQTPEIREKIETIIWMGGAFRTGGNVQTFEHNGSAEWNVYWDPESARRLLEMELPITCIPLDATDKVPVTMEFLKDLSRGNQTLASELAGQFWALTIDTIPGYHYTYFMWDILAASYLEIPEAFRVEEIKASVSTRPPNAGQTIENASGKNIKVALDIDKEAFYSYLLKQLSKT
jgi:purine nucleosidase